MTVIAALTALVGLCSVASAHVGMEDPPPRYPSDGLSANKSCPCGEGPNDQVCSGPVRSDPNRSTTVTEYTAGAAITVSAHEVIGHSGRWRIAFDPDGADLDDFNANILLDIADPPGGDGNVGQGDLWEFDVVLPNLPCANCTLQLIQVMNGDTVNPVPDPTGESSYYQCADIVLLAAGTTTTGETGADTDTDTDTTGGTDGATDGATDSDPTGGTDTPGTSSGTDGTDAPATDGVGVEPKACACDGGAGGLGLGVGGLLVAGIGARRRRPVRSS